MKSFTRRAAWFSLAVCLAARLPKPDEARAPPRWIALARSTSGASRLSNRNRRTARPSNKAIASSCFSRAIRADRVCLHPERGSEIMNRIRYNSLAIAVVAICTVLAMGAGVAHATPVITGAKDSLRVFNDCAVTLLTTGGAYPGNLHFDETQMLCTGGANLHIWNLSPDGGLSSAMFNNKDAFTISATVQLNSKGGPVSPGVGLEGGLRICPWWDSVANGFFNMRLPDGEIACFGGVLPFFTFTGAFGVHYLNNTMARQTIIYVPNCNTKDNPAT